jgi:tetratricopeptide (TPR) repeat protein
MDQQEQQDFSNRMAADPLLDEQVKRTGLLFLGIKEATLQEKLAGFHQELGGVKNEKAPVRRMFPAKLWLAAASVIVVLAIGFFWMINRSSGSEQLYAGYFEPDPGLMTTMGVSEDYEFDRAMVDYKTRKYQAAIERWEKLALTRPSNDTLNYFLGSAYLASGDPGKAIPFLEKTVSQAGSAFNNDATWYLGLALLKEGKKQEAISILQKADHPRKQELLSELK